MIVVGLHGPKQSGKDAAFEEIQKWASERGVLAIRRGFADKLKLSAARLFFPDIGLEEAVAWADAFKFRGKVDALPASPRFVKGADDEWLPEDIPSVSITGRELLQRYGTESHRDVFGANFWVDQLLPTDELRRIRRICEFRGDDNRLPEILCVTDVRFKNEAQRIRDLPHNATTPWISDVCRIERPSLASDDAHSSEVPLEPHLIDVTLMNDGTLEDWQATVRRYADQHLTPALAQLERT